MIFAGSPKIHFSDLRTLYFYNIYITTGRTYKIIDCILRINLSLIQNINDITSKNPTIVLKPFLPIIRTFIFQ